jgi:hypothetical protein
MPTVRGFNGSVVPSAGEHLSFEIGLAVATCVVVLRTEAGVLHIVECGEHEKL